MSASWRRIISRVFRVKNSKDITRSLRDSNPGPFVREADALTLHHCLASRNILDKRIKQYFFLQINSRWKNKTGTTQLSRLSTWPFRSIFKSLKTLLHDQKDEIPIFPYIGLARYSALNSNRYSCLYMIRKTKSQFSRISTWLDIQIDTQIGIYTST